MLHSNLATKEAIQQSYESSTPQPGVVGGCAVQYGAECTVLPVPLHSSDHVRLSKRVENVAPVIRTQAQPGCSAQHF
jgi:hypothetical protein